MREVLLGLPKAALIFSGLLAIGLLTRIPALCWSGSYAVHGVYASAFYALLYSFVLGLGWPTWSLVAGCLCYGVLLGGMHPVMGISAIVPLCLALAVGKACTALCFALPDVVAPLVFAASVYPVTLLAGVAFGSCSVSSEGGALRVMILIAIAFALGLLGSLAGSSLALRMRTLPH